MRRESLPFSSSIRNFRIYQGAKRLPAIRTAGDHHFGTLVRRPDEGSVPTMPTLLQHARFRHLLFNGLEIFF